MRKQNLFSEDAILFKRFCSKDHLFRGKGRRRVGKRLAENHHAPTMALPAGAMHPPENTMQKNRSAMFLAHELGTSINRVTQMRAIRTHGDRTIQSLLRAGKMGITGAHRMAMEEKKTMDNLHGQGRTISLDALIEIVRIPVETEQRFGNYHCQNNRLSHKEWELLLWLVRKMDNLPDIDCAEFKDFERQILVKIAKTPTIILPKMEKRGSS